MSIHMKISGIWTTVTRPYIKRNDVHVPAQEVWVRRSGVWVRSYEYDNTPPPAPQITLTNVVTGQGGNYIKLGVQIPGAHDPDVRKIRVLSTYNDKQPTTQFGGTFTSKPDDNYPNESWSDWEFDGVQRQTNVERYKTWPPSATANTQLAGGKTYYFSAWALDDAGNWSQPTNVQIAVPKKGVATSTVLNREATFQAVFSGSYYGTTLTVGDARQEASPRTRGVFGYGSRIKSSIGESVDQPNKITIKKAQIFLVRKNDSGAANANIYLGWTVNGTTGSYSSGPQPSNTVKIGRLAKGEAKWFDLPESFNAALKGDIGGFVLAEKNPDSATAGTDDFSVLRAVADNARSGELHVVWTETL